MSAAYIATHLAFAFGFFGLGYGVGQFVRWTRAISDVA